jgi:hypothetical protein
MGSNPIVSATHPLKKALSEENRLAADGEGG